MDEELKGKLDAAFDEGRLSDLPVDTLERVEADPEASAYIARLTIIEKGLSTTAITAIHIPHGFREAALKRLPGRRMRSSRAINLHNILLIGYFVVLAVVCFIFRDALGITALFNMFAAQLEAGRDVQPELLFSVFSSIGILGVSWLIISSFFGIRSRRITK